MPWAEPETFALHQLRLCPPWPYVGPQCLCQGDVASSDGHRHRRDARTESTS